jgi:hypothetical protein
VELKMSRLSRPKVMLISAIIVCIVTFGGVVWSERGREVASHLTIYVDPVIARDGGLIIISGIPIARSEWEELTDTDAVAMWDTSNGKHQQVKPGDKHFGVIVTSKATAIELIYPEDGTYTFNFLKVPSDNASPALITERISDGSATDIRDPATGKMLDWPSESIIAVNGAERSANWARTVDARFFVLTGPESHKYYRTSSYAGGRMIEITEDGILKLDVKVVNE